MDSGTGSRQGGVPWLPLGLYPTEFEHEGPVRELKFIQGAYISGCEHSCALYHMPSDLRMTCARTGTCVSATTQDVGIEGIGQKCVCSTRPQSQPAYLSCT